MYVRQKNLYFASFLFQRQFGPCHRSIGRSREIRWEQYLEMSAKTLLLYRQWAVKAHFVFCCWSTVADHLTLTTWSRNACHCMLVPWILCLAFTATWSARHFIAIHKRLEFYIYWSFPCVNEMKKKTTPTVYFKSIDIFIPKKCHFFCFKNCIALRRSTT